MAGHQLDPHLCRSSGLRDHLVAQHAPSPGWREEFGLARAGDDDGAASWRRIMVTVGQLREQDPARPGPLTVKTYRWVEALGGARSALRCWRALSLTGGRHTLPCCLFEWRQYDESRR